MRIVGLSTLAALAVAAIVAAGASAAPTYYECAKTAKGVGKYLVGCTEEAAEGAGTYEIQEGIGKGKAFKGKGGALIFHIPANGGEFTCKASTEEGHYTVTGQEKVKITITGCEILGKTCQTAGAKLGEVKTNSLSGSLGYISAVGPKIGIALAGEEGTPWAVFECGSGAGTLHFVVTSAVIGELTGDVNHFGKEVTKAYTVTGGGFQTVARFEGGPLQVLEYSINESIVTEMGIATTTAAKGENLEIKA